MTTWCKRLAWMGAGVVLGALGVAAPGLLWRLALGMLGGMLLAVAVCGLTALGVAVVEAVKGSRIGDGPLE